MRALASRYVKMDVLEPGSYDPRKAMARVPPLIKGYLRLGGFVGDGAVIDPEFNTTDVFIIVKTELVTEKYIRHYERGMRDQEGLTSADAAMWIGSPLRGAFRLLSYLSLTLVAVPIYLLAMALRIRRSSAGCRSLYHRLVCIILGIKVRVHGTALGRRSPTLYRLQPRLLSRHRGAGRADAGQLRRQGGGRDLAVLLDARQGAAHDLHRAQLGQDQRAAATR